MRAAVCGCLPGSPENNWFEIQSAACREAEREQWRRLMEYTRSPEFRALVDRMKTS